MGELTEFIHLYIESADVLEDILDKMALTLNENIQNQLYTGHGRITGNLRDSIQSDYSANGLNGVVRGYIGGTAEVYGWAVNDGSRPHDIPHAFRTKRNPDGITVHHPGFKGYHFMEKGLEQTCALYR